MTLLVTALANTASAAHGDSVEWQRRLYAIERTFVDGVVADPKSVRPYLPATSAGRTTVGR